MSTGDIIYNNKIEELTKTEMDDDTSQQRVVVRRPQRVGLKYHTVPDTLRYEIIKKYQLDLKTAKTIGDELDIAASTVNSIIKNWNKKHIIKLQKSGHRLPKLSPDNLKWLENYLRQDCTLTLKEICKVLLEHRQITISSSSIARTLVKDLWSLKNITILQEARNTEIDIISRFKYSDWFDRQNPIKMIYVDNVLLNHSRRHIYRYSDTGEQTIMSRKAIRSDNLTLTAAIDENGIICFKIHERSLKEEEFIDFIKQLINNNLEMLNKRNMFVIMDNSVRYIDIFKVFDGTTHMYKYIPEYSPYLNPFQDIFLKWKNSVTGECMNLDSIKREISEAAKSISSEDCYNCINKIRIYYIPLCAASQIILF